MRVLIRAVLISILCGGAAFAQPAAESFQQLVAALAAPEMQGRDAGTEGLARARDLLVTRFRQTGLSPGFHFGNQKSYTQPFDISLGIEATRQTLQLITGAGDSLFQPGVGSDFNALGFSGDGWFEGTPVFLGYGIRNRERGYDSYAGQPADVLEGKVAIVYRYEPNDGEGRSRWAKRGGPWTDSAAMPAKARWAVEHGAEAVLLVDPPSMESNALRGTSGSAFGDRMETPVYHLRFSAFQKILEAAGRDPQRTPRIYEERANERATPPDVLEGVTLRGDVALDRRAATIENVAALLPGAGSLADEIVVVGAHYDHLGDGSFASLSAENTGQLHPGADDNASGAAALVLIAEALRAWAAEADGDRRSILFIAFAGEERGLLGSMHLVRHPNDLPEPLANVVAMVNLDMVGRLRGDKLSVFGTESSDGWKALLRAANEPVGLKLGFSDAGAMAMSDHAAFNSVRIPAVHFFTGVHEDYHRPTDTADRINAEGGARVVALATGLVRELATREDRLSFNGETTAHATGGPGVPGGPGGPGLQAGGAYLGVMPDYNAREDEGGAALAGVSPGSPAEAAGLRAGDVLIAWNDEPLEGLEDLTGFLTAADPGERVRLTVRRAEGAVTFHVELGRR